MFGLAVFLAEQSHSVVTHKMIKMVLMVLTGRISAWRVQKLRRAEGLNSAYAPSCCHGLGFSGDFSKKKAVFETFFCSAQHRKILHINSNCF